MELLSSFEGSFGALLMVIGGVMAIISIHIVAPIKIMTDDRLLADKRVFNIAFGVGSVFFSPLILGYCFFNWARVRLPVLFGLAGLGVVVGAYFLRAAVALYFGAEYLDGM